MAVRRYTVECSAHGEMARDSLRCCWLCPADGCAARLDDESVYRLVARAPSSPDPLPLVVTA